MANTNRLKLAIQQIGLYGKLSHDDLAMLLKLVNDLDHALKVKNLKSAEKAIDRIAKTILTNA